MYEHAFFGADTGMIYATEYASFASVATEPGCLMALYDPTGCMGDSIDCWFSRPGELYRASQFAAENAPADDGRLARRIAAEAKLQKAEYICLLDTPAGAMLGDNLETAALEIEYLSGVPCGCIQTSGEKRYNHGQKLAYDMLFSLMKHQARRMSKAVNVLGMTKMDFNADEDYSYLKYFIEDCGYTVNARVGGGKTIEAIRTAPAAQFNFVLSMAAMPLAQRMQLEFGLPYYFVSMKGVSNRVKIAELLGCEHYEPGEVFQRQGRVLIIGEQAAANALREELRDIHGYADVTVACNFEFRRDMAQPGDFSFSGPEALGRRTAGCEFSLAIGDIAYKKAMSGVDKYIPMQHPAVSGDLEFLNGRRVLC